MNVQQQLQEHIKLSMGNKEFWSLALNAIFDFWALLGPKKGRGPIWVWDLKTQSKSLTTWWTFWVTCYLEIVFLNFLTLGPP